MTQARIIPSSSHHARVMLGASLVPWPRAQARLKVSISMFCRGNVEKLTVLEPSNTTTLVSKIALLGIRIPKQLPCEKWAIVKGFLGICVSPKIWPIGLLFVHLIAAAGRSPLPSHTCLGLCNRFWGRCNPSCWPDSNHPAPPPPPIPGWGGLSAKAPRASPDPLSILRSF